MLKTLGKTTWEEIEVGEVFAWNGCWCVQIKISDRECFDLADDCFTYFAGGEISPSCVYNCDSNLYKLPLSVQRLWREE